MVVENRPFPGRCRRQDDCRRDDEEPPHAATTVGLSREHVATTATRSPTTRTPGSRPRPCRPRNSRRGGASEPGIFVVAVVVVVVVVMVVIVVIVVMVPLVWPIGMIGWVSDSDHEEQFGWVCGKKEIVKRRRRYGNGGHTHRQRDVHLGYPPPFKGRMPKTDVYT